MNYELRWKQRFQSFRKAFDVLKRTLQRVSVAPQDDILQMALVQAFEFNYELSWNLLKDYLASEGYSDAKSPKQVIRTAFQAGLIASAEPWLQVVEKRNLASHSYNEKVLAETVAFIQTEFFPLVEQLNHDFNSRL
ncbi:MAG: nucleotidyltransferase [Fibrobacter sp.]|nr:nucleotidyltransferase [Fibrobacter sp.]